MSRILDVLRRFERENVANGTLVSNDAPSESSERILNSVAQETAPSFLTETVTEVEWTPKPLTVAPLETSRIVTITDPYSAGAESFRTLASRVTHIKTGGRNSVLVTSSVSDEGKTVIATNLALSLAKRATDRVLLIEGDLRAPKVLQALGAGETPGLCEWFQHGGSILDHIHHLESLGLYVLPAGAGTDDPVKLLDSESFSRAFALLLQAFDWIVVDSSPLAPVADALCWMRHIESVLLVTRKDRTPKNLLNKVLKSFDQKKIIGVVLNDSSNKSSAYSKYYGYQNYGNRGHAAAKAAGGKD